MHTNIKVVDPLALVNQKLRSFVEYRLEECFRQTRVVALRDRGGNL
jgi:hypothetical protein